MGYYYKIIIFGISQIFLFNHLQYVNSENILVYSAVGSHSVRISLFPYMEALAEKGHNVTFLSPFENFEDPEKKSKVNYYVPRKWQSTLGAWDDNYGFFDLRKSGEAPYMWYGFYDFGALSCEVLYSDPDFINFVETSTFDLVVMEYFVNECAYGLVHKFNAKFIVYGSSIVFPWCPDIYGLPDETSSIPEVTFAFPTGDKMTFVQRVMNALSPIVFSIKRDYSYLPALEEITRKGLKLGKDELPSFKEIEQSASLVLMTTHFTIDSPRSYPPHVIPVGGAVAGGSKVPKPLTKETEQFLNSATNGFIYISFGSIAEFASFDREVQLEFIRALHSFPEIKFLWKQAKDLNDTLPENVMLVKWAPQQTVLSHPNIKAFISHCGMGSTAESVHFGVPMVLIPVLGEQDTNAAVIESRGAGIRIEVTTLKQHELEHAISEILNNNKYQMSMTKLSEAFRDRPAQPVETAVWWTEYVLRHENSNDYLVPLSIRQPWWKRRQIDVWLALGAGLLISASVILTAFYFLMKSVFKILFSSNGKPKMSKVKSN